MDIKIGELAKRTGCRIVTVRYYEKEGLLKSPARSQGNYRLYGEHDIERLKFIMHCRRHGMSLYEVRKLLAYRDNPNADCVWVSRLIDSHVENVDEQIKSLLQLKQYLIVLQTKCSGGGSAHSCGIMKSLCNIESCSCKAESS